MFLAHGLQSVRVDRFGGLNTLVERMDLEPPASPLAQNVEYGPTLVKSRAGTTLVAEGLGGHLIGMDSDQLADARKLIALSDTGILSAEDTEGTLTSKATAVLGNVTDNPRMFSSTLYTRAVIMASSTLGVPATQGIYGFMEPRTYDGTNQDRFTYGPPGSAPTFADSGSPGAVIAGTRIGAVAFLMRSGLVTVLTWSVSFITGGAQTIAVTNIPIGPPACVARYLFVSSILPPGGTQFTGRDLYWVPAIMTINDNTTTSWEVNFEEAQLLSGQQASDFIGYDALCDAVGSMLYNNRALVFGELQPVRIRDNATIFDLALAPESNQGVGLRFDGGGVGGTGDPPGGWTEISAGGSFEVMDGAVNPAWKITSDGATSGLGEIRNGQAYGSSTLEAMLALNVEYGVRLHMMRSDAAIGGTIKVTIGTNPGPTIIAELVFSIATLSDQGWRPHFLGSFTITDYADDLFVSIQMDQPTVNGEWAAISGGIDFFRLSESRIGLGDGGYIRASLPFDPERFDSTTGFISVQPGSGQNTRAMFQLGSTAYSIGERSMSAIYDNGVTEPSGWTVSLVSNTIGTFSPRCVSQGEQWVAILARDGLYLFDGGVPRKLSDEIQPTWNSFAWAKGHLFWCVVDIQQQLIYCAVIEDPSSNTPDALYVLYYRDGFGPSQRKWSKWTGSTICVKSGSAIVRSDGLTKAFFGGTDIMQRDGDAVNDDQGRETQSAIDSLYETAPLGLDMGVTLTGYLTIFCSGAGVLDVFYRLPNDAVKQFWQPVLSDPARRQLERPMKLDAERVGIRFGTNTLDYAWSMKRLELYQRPSPNMQYRGRNS